jgi:tRNA(Arg) A34 adenosine deaminase TadA
VAAGSVAALFGPRTASAAKPSDSRFIAEAFSLRDMALAAGDQPYGAVIVLRGAVVGRGRSRVVADRDESRHAERVALKDAQDRLGRERIDGAIIYSSAIPCPYCQPMLARAGVVRMIHGRDALDAGAPRAEEP